MKCPVCGAEPVRCAEKPAPDGYVYECTCPLGHVFRIHINGPGTWEAETWEPTH